MIFMDVLKEAFQLLLHPDRELTGILLTTLVMSFSSTGISAALGIPLGIAIGKRNFPGKGLLLRVINTAMALPPVLAGLIVFILFRSIGPFGKLQLMFTVPVMVVAQVLLITPVICGLTAAGAAGRYAEMRDTLIGRGIPRGRQTFLLIRESAPQLIGFVLMGFGRSIAEVGAVSLVGGNIQFKTRVMTTAILLEANKGNFEKAIALGIVLMLLSFLVNLPAYSLQKKLR